MLSSVFCMCVCVCVCHSTARQSQRGRCSLILMHWVKLRASRGYAPRTHAQRTHARTHAQTHTRAQTHIHARARTHTHAHTHARTHIHTCTHTHTHTKAHVLSLSNTHTHNTMQVKMDIEIRSTRPCITYTFSETPILQINGRYGRGRFPLIWDLVLLRRAVS